MIACVSYVAKVLELFFILFLIFGNTTSGVKFTKYYKLK
jgi:hypothetical protein